MTAAQFGNIVANSSNQYNQFSGGNTQLTPEVSDTFSVGAVLSPGGFLQGLMISAEYFDIQVKNAIGTVGAQIILNQCLASGNQIFCSLVQRDPSNGSLLLGTAGQVVSTNLIVGRLRTRGFDISAATGSTSAGSA